MANVRRFKNSFQAFDDSGVIYNINVYAEHIDVSSHDDKHAEDEGIKELITDSGERVDYIKKGEYKLFGSNKSLHSNDPAAP